MKKTIQFLKSLLHSNDSVVIACSGGPDSMCLLSLLLSIRAELNLNLIVAHVNHKVRQEAEEEAHFVKKYAQDHQCQFFYLELPPNSKENFESYARAKRYEFFREVVEKNHAQYLCTAHHGDDLIETILMRLTRGSNLKGYSGFPIITSNDGYKLIRPLIFYSKEEIKSYLDIHNIDLPRIVRYKKRSKDVEKKIRSTKQRINRTYKDFLLYKEAFFIKMVMMLQ